MQARNEELQLLNQITDKLINFSFINDDLSNIDYKWVVADDRYRLTPNLPISKLKKTTNLLGEQEIDVDYLGVIFPKKLCQYILFINEKDEQSLYVTCSFKATKETLQKISDVNYEVNSRYKQAQNYYSSLVSDMQLPQNYNKQGVNLDNDVYVDVYYIRACNHLDIALALDKHAIHAVYLRGKCALVTSKLYSLKPMYTDAEYIKIVTDAIRALMTVIYFDINCKSDVRQSAFKSLCHFLENNKNSYNQLSAILSQIINELPNTLLTKELKQQVKNNNLQLSTFLSILEKNLASIINVQSMKERNSYRQLTKSESIMYSQKQNDSVFFNNKSPVANKNESEEAANLSQLLNDL